MATSAHKIKEAAAVAPASSAVAAIATTASGSDKKFARNVYILLYVLVPVVFLYVCQLDFECVFNIRMSKVHLAFIPIVHLPDTLQWKAH